MPPKKAGGPKRFAFTQARLAKLPVPEKGRATYHDTKTPGLCIRVSSTGHKAAYLSRKVKGRHVKLKLGTWNRDIVTVAALRDGAERALASIDTLATQRRQARQEATLGDLWVRWEEYMRAHKKPKSQGEDARYYRTHLAKWGNRPLSEIARSDVAGLHSRVGRKNGTYTANRLLALLSAMFNEARRAGMLPGENPCAGVRRFKEESRDRWLDGEDLRAFFMALYEEDPLLRDYFILLLLTGSRKMNLAAMRWEQLDLERGLWRIPDAKGGVPLVIPLVQPAVAILTRRQTEANGREWVFPGRSRQGHIAPSNRKWQRICQRAGLEDCRLHDLRRTLGSWMAVGGTSLPIVGKALGHRSLQTTEVYARLSTEPVRDAIEKATAAMVEAGGVELLTEDRGEEDDAR